MRCLDFRHTIQATHTFDCQFKCKSITGYEVLLIRLRVKLVSCRELPWEKSTWLKAIWTPRNKTMPIQNACCVSSVYPLLSSSVKATEPTKLVTVVAMIRNADFEFILPLSRSYLWITILKVPSRASLLKTKWLIRTSLLVNTATILVITTITVSTIVPVTLLPTETMSIN